jgi:hypothetical protein
MTPVRPVRWCCRIVELAARTLPAEHRHRYALEFTAELYGMPRRRQVWHSLQVLSRAWALRAAVADAPSTLIEENAMTQTLQSWLLCHAGWHRWEQHRNPEVGGRDAVFQLCARCGRERQGYEPPPPGAIVGG